MGFDPHAYGREVAAILALDGAGERLMPLVREPCSSEEARRQIRASGARKLFPDSCAPEAALAGLYFYFGCWTEAHETAQEVGTPEGSYWHAMVHRQEPDAGNSAYWFRQVGEHPVFFELARIAGVARWNPLDFIRQCEHGSTREQELQRAEWQLLFDYCAAKRAIVGSR